jgi:chemotaxis protein MotB
MTRGKQAHRDEHGGDEAWVIPYADLVTLLLGFFILLWATADANQVKMEALARGLADAFNVGISEGAGADNGVLDGGSGLVPGRHDVSLISFDFDAIRAMIEERSREAGVPGQIRVSQQDDRIVIRLADNLLFASASADVRPEALPLLEIVAEALATSANEIRVEGHTDNIPLATDRYPSNWELSAARATAVLRLLSEEFGVAPERMHAAGFGEFEPIASNLTPEGRALNRRADVVILYPPATITNTNPGIEGVNE